MIFVEAKHEDSSEAKCKTHSVSSYPYDLHMYITSITIVSLVVNHKSQV